jgi:proteic killer suppression protein
MQIRISDRKLKRELEDDTECRRRYGVAMAKKIKLRMDALCAAESLADFWPPFSGPERCHELQGQLAGTFSIDVKQPYRLLFREDELGMEAEPNAGTQAEQGNSTKGKDERQRWLGIRSIEIKGIKDTHG